MITVASMLFGTYRVPGVLDAYDCHKNCISCDNCLVGAIIILVLEMRNQEASKIRYPTSHRN